MMDDIALTQSLFEEYFTDEEEYNSVFITQSEIAAKFTSAVERIAKQNSELFASEIHILTEPVPPLCKKKIGRIAEMHGYLVKCGMGHKRVYYHQPGQPPTETIELIIFQTIRVRSYC